MKSYYNVQDNKDANTYQNNAFPFPFKVITNKYRFTDRLQLMQQETLLPIKIEACSYYSETAIKIVSCTNRNKSKVKTKYVWTIKKLDFISQLTIKFHERVVSITVKF